MHDGQDLSAPLVSVGTAPCTSSYESGSFFAGGYMQVCKLRFVNKKKELMF